ncbi:MAG: ComF family protein [Clostridia bacterium]|nr:ComF family protein [Clostridia bacterium]
MKKPIKETLLWMFFTKHCLYCNKVVDRKSDVCEDCRENLPIIKDEKCKYCGVEKIRCNCKNHRKGYDGISAPFYYEKNIRESIRLLKFNGKDFIANQLSDDMAESVKSDFKDIVFDMICFVPFSKGNKLTRKYNPSELLAKHLSKKLEIPLKPTLTKLYENENQRNLSMMERIGNVFGVFDVVEDADIKDKTILLVDDVKTTGATLSNCAWILKIRGAKNVYCATVAITPPKKDKK